MKIWRHFDFWLIGAVALLIVFGLAMIRSAVLSSPDAGERELSRQLIFALAGIAIVMGLSAIDYRFWGRVSGWLYGVLMILLILVAVLGDAVFGAKRWIPLFGGLYNLQPSEIGKFVMILGLGHYLINHPDETRKFSFIVRTLIYIGVPVLLIAVQPDFSTCILYGVIWLALLWPSGLRVSHLLFMGGVAIALGIIGFFVALQSDEARYIAQRVVFFILPDNNSQEFRDATYNITQSLISVGSGGWFGQGYGVGSQVQSRFLKVRHTDFIFATIAHELGFVGAVFTIGLFVFIIFRIFQAGWRARDAYGQLICYAIGTVILFEAFSNIASTLDILPVTGSPLPFVSYGGSSLWTFLAGIGLVQSVILRQKQIEF